MIEKTQKYTNKFKTALTVGLFVLMPLAVFIIISSKSSVILGIRSFTVVSGSMEPNLPVGSIVFSTPTKTYDLNDVVTFNSKSGNFVTHRIFQTMVENGQLEFATKGDANKIADNDRISKEQIIGKVILTIPLLGKAGEYVKNPWGFALLVILPCIAYVASEVMVFKRELEKEIEKKLQKQLGLLLK